MDSYKVIVSPKALSQLNNYIDYIQYTLLNEDAAYRVWQDAIETRNQLAVIAGSLKYCSHPKLKELGYRSVNFKEHRYTMIYRVNGREVYVEAIYHQLQDYENIFADESGLENSEDL
ncbi:type II toxin-antitoxin system RelE/ParE family toxin [Lachnospiraceae bacterium 54-11]|jgi:plasmid stabilization system protein ParE|nr:type II toxin-antitoxin system RelE/ParE family toxin [Lachnospiraceae bacterium]